MWKLVFSGTKDTCGLIIDVLEPYAESLSCFEKDERDQIWQVEALYLSQPDLKLLEKEHSILKDLFLKTSLEKVPDKDWLKENQASFEPLEIGPFFIYDGHTTPHFPLEKVVFEINASTAFGTGRHATTKGCLEALNYLKENNYSFSRPLDLGCGTGILALAISQLFETSVCAIDNDPEAVTMTQENAFKNGLAELILPTVSQGFSDPFFLTHSQFDLITANILAQPLVDLAPQMAQFIQPGGVLILSGFYESQKDDLLKAYASSFSEVKSWVKEEWMILALKRKFD